MADTDVSKTEPTGVANLDYGEHAGAGFEGQTSADSKIPFLLLLQGLSPQVGGPKAVPGASPGKFMNSVSERVYGDSVLFVPAKREKSYVEWVPRAQGGGFVGRHAVDSDLVARAKEKAGPKAFGKLKHPDSENELVETVYLYGVVCDGERPADPVVVAFKSTALAPLRAWNTRVKTTQIPVAGRKQTPPLFAHLTRVSTVSQSNKKGTFFNYVLGPAKGDMIDSLLRPDDERFRAAVSLRDLVESGAAKAAEETLGASETPEEDRGNDEIFA
jgi:hypothetical protein